MAETVYDSPTAAASGDLVGYENGPVTVPSPRGLLSVASVVDVSGPARWGVNAALYEHFADFPAASGARSVSDGVFNSTSTVTSAAANFTSADVGSLVTGTGVPTGTYIGAVVSESNVTLTNPTTATGTGRSITITPRVGKGVEKMDPADRCPSPPVGAATEMDYGRASAYMAWSRIACVGLEADASSFVRSQYAAREQVLMEMILAAIVAETANTNVGTNLGAAFAAAERAFSRLHVGQGTVWLDYETLYKASDAGILIEQGNSLYTYAGNRVATSPVFTQDIAITPNLTVQREASVEVLDFYERSTGLADALAQRLYLYMIDPATDVVAATLA